MCNLYSQTKAREAVLRLFQIGHNRAASFEPKDAIFPGHAAPVVRRAGDGALELTVMSWGFVLPQPGRAPRRVTNFRDDKTRQSPFWRESFELRRCLVPATSFAEPRQVTPATWNWFALCSEGEREDSRPLFSLAGIWRRFRGPLKKDGAIIELDVFSVMTTLPNPLVATINHERMPVILGTEADRAAWLDGSPDDGFRLARRYPEEAMQIVQENLEKRDLMLSP